MMKQISIFVKMELCNLYGWNVFRYTKDKGEQKKSIALGVVIGLCILMLMSYIGGMSYGYITLGVPNIIPIYLILISSVLTLAMVVFKVGGILFRRNGYDILSALPVPTFEGGIINVLYHPLDNKILEFFHLYTNHN